MFTEPSPSQIPMNFDCGEFRVKDLEYTFFSILSRDTFLHFTSDSESLPPFSLNQEQTVLFILAQLERVVFQSQTTPSERDMVMEPSLQVFFALHSLLALFFENQAPPFGLESKKYIFLALLRIYRCNLNHAFETSTLESSKADQPSKTSVPLNPFNISQNSLFFFTFSLSLFFFFFSSSSFFFLFFFSEYMLR